MTRFFKISDGSFLLVLHKGVLFGCLYVYQQNAKARDAWTLKDYTGNFLTCVPGTGMIFPLVA